LGNPELAFLEVDFVSSTEKAVDVVAERAEKIKVRV
jgi:hypothetical protein